MDPKQFQLDWIKKHGVHHKKEEEESVAPARKKFRKVVDPAKRNYPFEAEVDEEVDLHGLTVDQGLLAVENAIKRGQEFKLKRIRIIHGFSHADGPTLRVEVRRFLDTRASEWINGYKMEVHNAGAVIIFPKI